MGYKSNILINTVVNVAISLSAVTVFSAARADGLDNCVIALTDRGAVHSVHGPELKVLYEKGQTLLGLKEVSKAHEVSRFLDQSRFGYDYGTIQIRYHIDEIRTHAVTDYVLGFEKSTFEEVEKLHDFLRSRINVKLQTNVDLLPSVVLIQEALMDAALRFAESESTLLSDLLQSSDWHSQFPDLYATNARSNLTQFSQNVIKAAQARDAETLRRATKVMGRILKFGYLKIERENKKR